MANPHEVTQALIKVSQNEVTTLTSIIERLASDQNVNAAVSELKTVVANLTSATAAARSALKK